MRTSDLLAKLLALGVKLWAEDDELGISAPKGVLTSELVQEIRDHKAELLVLLANRGSLGTPAEGIRRAAPTDERPLSFSQRRLWFLDQLEPGTATYNMPLAWTIHGPLDVERFRRALEHVLERHEILRARFLSRSGAPAIAIDAPAPLELAAGTMDVGSREERLAAVRAELSRRAEEPFDLERGGLLRPALFEVAPTEHVFFLLVHHIVFDGWSAEVLLRELASVYESLAAGAEEPALPSLPIQYTDYAAWQEDYLESEAFAQELAFHRDALGENTPLLELPADRPRPPIQSYRGANLRRRLDPGLSRELEALARREGVTLYMLLLAAYEVLLTRWSRQEDFTVGTIVANRGHAEVEGLVGFFANTLVLRCDLSGEPSFRELLGRVRDTTLEVFEHQEVPFEKLVEELKPERSLAHTPLYQTLFMTESESGTRQAMGALELELFELEARVARTDLMLTVHERSTGLEAWAEYSTDLFDAATVERLLAGYETLLTAIVHDPGRSIHALELLTKEERARLLGRGSGPQVARSSEPLHRQFEEQVDRTPERVALRFPARAKDDAADRALTYAELDAEANRIAHHLASVGVVPGSLVGLALDRSLEMVAALLGILKAGAAYVPLDPSYPADRLAYMVEDARLAVCVSTRALRSLLPDALTVVELDGDRAAIEACSVERPAVPVAETDRSYVIYTSGSTGRPKGVELEHRSVSNFLASMALEPGFAEGESLLAVTTLSFDISVLEVLLPLSSGGTTIVAPREATLDGQALIALLERFEPDVLQATPATWRLLVMSGWRGSPKLRAFSGGEALARELADELLPRCAELWNLYGPTETTIWSTVARVRREDRAPTIGRPIAATSLYVLDAHHGLTPEGVPGELWIAGAGLARGYLDRPELTAERFPPDPFDPDGSRGGRMYRTGDEARWLPNGELECLGRVDDQVKLRGFRIELGEIESVLTEHAGVRECVCVVREDTPGDQRLTAFFTSHAEVSERELRELAQGRLPAYMVPSTFVPLAALPQTPNGKVDRPTLRTMELEPGAASRDDAADGAPARTDTERVVAGIWAQVLGLERVSTVANFFDLGGHSLLLAEVRGRLEEALGRELTVIELFQYPTIASLAAHLDAGDAGAGSDADPRGARAGRLARVRRSLAGEGSAIRSTDVAVVGLAGRFPRSPDVEAFWRNLRAGVECISFFDQEELRAAGVAEEELAAESYVPAWGWMEDVDRFDAGFFEMTPREAEITDPQIRLLLECAWETLEDAGCDPTRFPGRIGVFAGSSMMFYLWENLVPTRGLLEALGTAQTWIQNDRDFVATRINYKLDLRGPGVTVQTACSTSLVAVHFGVQSLLNGESDLVLCGGVAAPGPYKEGYHAVEGGTLSPDGHVRTFDANARGMLGGNGVALVALKRLEDALADGDPIRAVIKGSAINNDGVDKVTYTAPSVEGQVQCLLDALEVSGVDPETIGYMEAHGTGTPLGDPIEIAALTQAWGRQTERRGWCPIGSVKTNVGHLDTAAGVTGFIKAVLALERREIPPSLNFETPNPEIDFAASPFFVNTELRPFERGDAPRRAAVSSLGMGGTNAHAILEEAPEREPASASRAPRLLPLSARSDAALERACERLADHLEAHPELSLADVACTLQTGRRAFARRLAVVANDRAEAIEALRTRDAGRTVRGTRDADAGTPVAFLFSGQGAQYANMTRGLYEGEALFRREVDRCCDALVPTLGLDLRDLLFPEPGAETRAQAELERTQHTQPALFVVEYALARLLESWGLVPEAMLGHSIGEYVAAALAEVVSLEDALRLVAARGRLIGALPSGGGMLAVTLPEEEVRALDFEQAGLSIAAVNAPELTVVSGSEEDLAAFEARLTPRGVDARRLHTSHAFHSALMDPVLADFRAELDGVRLRAPRRPIVSCTTGTWLTEAEATDPEYWVRHLREAVRFADGVHTLCEEERLLVEVGPGETLASLARLTAPESTCVATTRHPRAEGDDAAVLRRALGALWSDGAAIDWEALHAGETRHRVSLPTYPFERRRYWIEKPATDAGLGAALHKQPDLADWFFVPSWRRAAAPIPLERAARRWLVYDDGGAMARELVESLGATSTLFTVRRGEVFSREGDAFTIDGGDPEQHRRLLDELERDGGLPSEIVYLWSFEGHGEQALEGSLHGLLHLAQALGARELDEPVRVDVVTCGMAAVLEDAPRCPEQSAVLGPCMAMNLELAGVTARSLDVEEGVTSAQVLQELTARTEQPVLALRAGHRWSLGHERTHLPEGAPSFLREGSVVLVTGGLGGIGLALGEALAQEARAKLVLVGRTPLPPRDAWDAWIAEHGETDPTSARLLGVRRLEAAGAEVMVLCADCTDRSAMADVLAQVQQRFGAVHGAIHAAGVPASGLMASERNDALSRVLAPKVRGARVLREVLRDEPLEFVLLCSSIASVCAGFGQVDYASANLFLDAFALSWSAEGPHVVAANWEFWSETGMAMDTEVPESLRATRDESLRLGITSDEGREAFRRLLRARLPQVVVSPRELTAREDYRMRFDLAFSAEMLARAGSDEPQGATRTARQGAPRPELSTAHVAPRTETEARVAAIWGDLLGIEGVGVEDDFFELGGNSLVLMQVNVRLRAELGVSFPIGDLFELPRVELLAERVDSVHMLGEGPPEEAGSDGDVEEFSF